MKRPFDRPIARMKGESLEGLRFRHPLYERDSVAVLADYVTLDQGTGAVHTAPGHGADDFLTGVKYGLEIYAPIGPGGRFLDNVELFAGQRVFDANPERRAGASRTQAGSGIGRPSRTSTRTAGAATIRSSFSPRRSGSSGSTAIPSSPARTARPGRCARRRAMRSTTR